MSNTEETNGEVGKPTSQPSEKKPNMLKTFWGKLGITTPVLILMIKGGLPPTIVLAALEGKAFSDIYTTLGYLVAIMSHLSLAIQPRAKFVQSMIFSLIFTCTGAAVALLEIQCVVAARSPPPATSSAKTGSSGSSESSEYDSSACAVAAIFLFIFVYITNLVRAIRPQLTIPLIMTSIFCVVASVYAPSFPNMTVGMDFIRRLLISFLTGFAIATGVSLFVFPITSRKMVSMQMVGVTGLMKATLAAHGSYMSAITNYQKDHKAGAKRGHEEAQKLRQMMQQMEALFGKVRLELGFARKEIAWGKLKPDDFTAMHTYFREIVLPINGLTTFMEMMQSVQEHGEGSNILLDSERHAEAIRRLQTEEWDEVMSMSHQAYLELRAAISGGLDHVNYQLELTKRPKSIPKDVEKKAGSIPNPGDKEFTPYLEAEVQKFHDQREAVLRTWAEKKNVQLPEHFWEDGQKDLSLNPTNTMAVRNQMNQQQLYLILFLEYLTHQVGKAILNMAKFADSKVDDGTMSRSRLILPGWRRLKKLMTDALNSSDADETMTNNVNGGTNIFVGDAFKQQKDPEHLPPVSLYERITSHWQAVPKLLRSENSSFAFRAAMAALSVGIIAYLKDTRSFFLEQRGLWAIIMTSISMDPRAGQSVFAYICRVGGTALSMCISIIIWYMCDGKHAAIIPIFFIQTCLWILFIIKLPNFTMVGMVSAVTVILIIGYELQVGDVGIQVATSNGQAYYPIYLLAPYRLAAVAAGIGAAFIWTYLPYPVTTRSTLRKDLGSCLFLLANWYSCVHTTLEVKLHFGPKIHELDKGPVTELQKARLKVFGKMLLMLNNLQTHLHFVKFDAPLGGKFPKETYSELISSMRNTFSYLALMVHSVKAFTGEGVNGEVDEESNEWLKDFREFAASTKMTSHELTSSLCLMSASVSNSTPLPPYVRVPRPYRLGDRIQDIDPEVLSIEHIAHPCYAAFAVMEVASAFVTAEMTQLVKKVKELVGEVDFSFHVVSTNEDGSEKDTTLWDGLLKQIDSSVSGSGKPKDD